MIMKLCQLIAGMKQGTFSWKNYEENMHQKLVPDPFLINNLLYNLLTYLLINFSK